MDSSSDDDTLLLKTPLFKTKSSGASQDDDLARALKASNESFKREQEQLWSQCSSSPSKKKRVQSFSDAEEDFGELEVIATPYVKSENKKRTADGPRLSASGGSSKDPIAPDDDDDHIEVSLMDRVRRNLDSKGSPAKKRSYDLSDSDDDPPKSGRKRNYIRAVSKSPSDDELNGKPVAKPTPRKDVDVIDISSDDDSVDTKPKPKAAPRIDRVRFSSDEDSDSVSGKLKSITTSKSNITIESSSDSDSSDSEAVPKTSVAKKPTVTREEREQIRLKKRQEKEAKKKAREAEKTARAARKAEEQAAKEERKRLQKEKKAKAEAEKEERKRRRETAACNSGRRANEELAVLMSADLYLHPVMKIKEALTEAGYKPFRHANSISLGSHTMQFVRRTISKGGATAAFDAVRAYRKAEYDHVYVVCIIFDTPHNFLDLLVRDGKQDDDDYPKLKEWIEKTVFTWQRLWRLKPPDRPRLFVLLNGVEDALEKLWVNLNKRKKDASTPPTMEELHDALTWVLIQYQVECLRCSNKEEIIKTAKKMTRMVAEEPYAKEISELDGVKKLKSQVSDFADDQEKAEDCWKRQLQQVPGVSLTIASSIVKYYPTMRSLLNEYQSDKYTEDEKRGLLVNCCGNTRKNKISDHIYRILTSEDENELLV